MVEDRREDSPPADTPRQGRPPDAKLLPPLALPLQCRRLEVGH